MYNPATQVQVSIDANLGSYFFKKKIDVGASPTTFPLKKRVGSLDIFPYAHLLRVAHRESAPHVYTSTSKTFYSISKSAAVLQRDDKMQVHINHFLSILIIKKLQRSEANEHIISTRVSGWRTAVSQMSNEGL
jgi:hypothetical protein